MFFIEKFDLCRIHVVGEKRGQRQPEVGVPMAKNMPGVSPDASSSDVVRLGE